MTGFLNAISSLGLLGGVVALYFLRNYVNGPVSPGTYAPKLYEDPKPVTPFQARNPDMEMVLTSFNLIDQSLRDRSGPHQTSTLAADVREQASSLVRLAYRISANRQKLEQNIQIGKAKQAKMDDYRERLKTAESPIKEAIEKALEGANEVKENNDLMEAQLIEGETQLNNIAGALTRLQVQLEANAPTLDLKYNDLQESLDNMKALSSALEEVHETDSTQPLASQ